MINLNELRVNNRITYKTVNLKGGGMVDQEIIVTVNTMKEIEMQDGKNHSPIPLSPEWLEMAGFVFNPELNGWGKDNWLPFHVEKRTTSYEWYFLTTFKKDWQIGKFQHVHQLQNLYFSLTGKELKITGRG